MRRRKGRALPNSGLMLMAELAAFSWETMAHRMRMIAEGTCSVLEYQRMVIEKIEAASLSSAALLSRKPTLRRALAPWHRRAGANARRLRR